jgi:hypothetical protein
VKALVVATNVVAVISSNKRTSLLSFGISYERKIFLIQAPDVCYETFFLRH